MKIASSKSDLEMRDRENCDQSLVTSSKTHVEHDKSSKNWLFSRGAQYGYRYYLGLSRLYPNV